MLNQKKVKFSSSYLMAKIQNGMSFSIRIWNFEFV